MTDKELAEALAAGLGAARAAQSRLAAERVWAAEGMHSKTVALAATLEQAEAAARALRAQLRAALDDPAKIGAIDFSTLALFQRAANACLEASERRAAYLHLLAPDAPPPGDVV